MSGTFIQLVAMLYISFFLSVESGIRWRVPIHRSGRNCRDRIHISCRNRMGNRMGNRMELNPIEILINAEIFALHVRATGSSLLMCFHYANQYGLSKVDWPPFTSVIQLTLIGCTIHVTGGYFSTNRNILVLFDCDAFWDRMGLVSAPRDCWPDIRGGKWLI